MIENFTQYQITGEQARKFRTALRHVREAVEAEPERYNNDMSALLLDAMESVAAELEEEMKTFEKEHLLP